MKRMLAARTGAALLSAACAGGAAAQEAINSTAATQPSTGRFVIREQFRYLTLYDDPSPEDRDMREIRATTTLIVGLSSEFSLSVEAPLAFRKTEFDAKSSFEGDSGLDDLTLLGKWRFFQHDFGPIETARASLIFGAELPSGDDPFTSDSVDPILGAVFMLINGRHGFNIVGEWKFNTGRDGEEFPLTGGDGPHDALFYDAAYLFRAFPADYSTTSAAAVYAVLELNGLYETNGDNEVFISPGLLYEARDWALELSVQIPVSQELDHRPKTDFVLVLGVRLLF